MAIDRRSFIQGASLLTAGPLFFYSIDALACAFPNPRLTKTQTSDETDARCVFKVLGWEQRDQKPVDRSKMLPSNLTPASLASDEVFIHVNRAWRTAWR
jgi:hypothetical protein